MVTPIVILFAVQALFTGGDLLSRHYLMRYGFTSAVFRKPWFIVYLVIRQLAMVGQLYVLSTIEIGRVMALLSGVSIILASTLGLVLLQEKMSAQSWIGIGLAVGAIFILASAPSG